MERRGEGEERVFDAFGGGGFVELLGEGDLGGVGEMMGVEEVGGGGEHAVRLVEGDGVGVERFLLRCPPAYPPPSSSSPSPAAFRMLCFGGDEGDNGQDGFSRKSSDSCSSTSSYSSSSSSKKKTEGRRGTSTKATAARARATTATAPKKPRKEQPQGQQPPCSQRRASKGRKEKLGERISALQQLVSPFGKSDTASVLHEALGYIRFLHDQVQGGVDGGGGAELRPDLRSRGLCLVPVACTAHVEASNGADFWSPAMGGGGDHRQPAVSKH